MTKFFRIALGGTALCSALFAAEIFRMPELTPESRVRAAGIYDKECYACHRWNRAFAGPDMKGNVSRYLGRPEALFDYLENPRPIHPDKYRPMEIGKLSGADASLMVAWLFSLAGDSAAADRPR